MIKLKRKIIKGIIKKIIRDNDKSKNENNNRK